MDSNILNIDRGTVLKWVLILVLAIAIYFSVRKVVKTIKGDSAQKAIDSEIKANELSYPLTQYMSMADQIEASFTYLTTDEDTIYSVFKKMNTLSDIAQLNKAFGVRQYYGFFGDASLAVFLQKGMSTSEIAEVNKILKTNNINFSF